MSRDFLSADTPWILFDISYNALRSDVTILHRLALLRFLFDISEKVLRGSRDSSLFGSPWIPRLLLAFFRMVLAFLLPVRFAAHSVCICRSCKSTMLANACLSNFMYDA